LKTQEDRNDVNNEKARELFGKVQLKLQQQRSEIDLFDHHYVETTAIQHFRSRPYNNRHLSRFLICKRNKP
jgi:hypothetical protein